MKDKRNSGSLIDEVRRVGDLSQSSLAKLLSLRDEVVQLKEQLARSIYPSPIASLNPGSAVSPTGASPHKIRIFFGRSQLERKPFTLSMSGPLEGSLSLSAVRTAILLVGFADIQDRRDGGSGVNNFSSQVTQVLGKLDVRAGSEASLAESVRVALYRFEQYLLSADEFRGEELRITYDSKEERLRLLPESPSAEIEVSSDDPLFVEIIDSLLTSSPLERLRKAKSMYVPPGPRGLERLLLEFYDHPDPLQVESIYFRPASICCPREFLLLSGASSLVLKRYDLALEGMASGRVQLTEILEESALRRLIERKPDGTSSFYPFPINEQQVRQHLDHLIWRLENLPGYQLIVTKSALPMYLVTYEIERPGKSEHYSLCGRHLQGIEPGKDFLSDVSSYLINDQLVTELLKEYTIGWVLKHPSTTTERQKVIHLLSTLKV